MEEAAPGPAPPKRKRSEHPDNVIKRLKLNSLEHKRHRKGKLVLAKTLDPGCQ